MFRFTLYSCQCEARPTPILLSHRALPLFGQYQTILLADSETCVNNLPRIVTQQNSGQSQPRSVDYNSDILIITPQSRTQ